jgi:hypothetical protein
MLKLEEFHAQDFTVAEYAAQAVGSVLIQLLRQYQAVQVGRCGAFRKALGSIPWFTTTKHALHLWNSPRFRIDSFKHCGNLMFVAGADGVAQDQSGSRSR